MGVETLNLSSMLRENCASINDTILEEMKRSQARVERDNALCKSDRLNLIMDDKNKLNDNPCLYRWLVSEEFIHKYLQNFIDDKDKYQELEDIIFHQNNRRIIEDTTYYAIYFGKSANGKNRIINQHLRGTTKKSTLRQTLFGLFEKVNSDITVDLLLNNSCFEWLQFDANEKERIVAYESICIALGSYLLNLDGNPAIGNNWRKMVMEARKLNK